MKLLAVTLGSAGDLLPFIVVGKALKDRGHHVIFAANRGYEALIRAEGFGFTSIWDRTPNQNMLDGADAEDAWRIVQLFEAAKITTFEFITSISRTEKLVLLASWSALGAQLAHEKLNAPLCRVYLSPHAIREGAHYLSSIASKDSFDKSNFRAVGFFPEWFSAKEHEWPYQLEMTGFPMVDDVLLPHLPADLVQFLKNGDRPVIFTPGTFQQDATSFFQVSLTACVQLNLRAIFLTPYSSQVPEGLPPTVVHFKYVHLQSLMKKCAAIVYHGGIGTCAQAMRAGIPQLIVPRFFDQFDNAARIESFGIGSSIARELFSKDNVMENLIYLLNTDAVKRNCIFISGKFEAQSAVPKICKIVESIA
jgi:UDP:flavonoid glycosyltransferase YjiC (YdhE family)